MTRAAAALVALAAACGGSQAAPVAPAPAASVSPEPAAPESCGGEPCVGKEEQQTGVRPRERPPIDIKNECGDVVGLSFGAEAHNATMRLGVGGSDKIARDPDGGLSVWLVDEKGFGLAHVAVTKRMKQVEVGRSCRTLYAH